MRDERIADLLDKILECASMIRSYMKELGESDFLRDRRTQDAVTMNLMALGEVASRLFRDHAHFLARFPDVEWHAMRGMRNRIAHGYFELDLKVIWETVTIFIPELIERLPAICEIVANEAERGGSDRESIS